jgi:gamma-glutamylcyclotransferase (GGCT)/AIG2-like uncharacterized protein YtfP
MTTPGPHTAFFYGTLMAPSVLYRVIYGNPKPTPAQIRQTTSTSALLDGYQRRKVRGCDYPAITTSEGGSVRGLLVTGLTDEHLDRLDTFEGFQYEREVVRVRVLREGDDGEEEIVEAETYVWDVEEGEGEEGGLEGEEWDFEEFQREKIHRWDGVLDWEDSGFEDVDRMVAEMKEAAKNDPTGGRAVNGKIGKELETLRSAV